VLLYPLPVGSNQICIIWLINNQITFSVAKRTKDELLKMEKLISNNQLTHLSFLKLTHSNFTEMHGRANKYKNDSS